MQKVDVYGDVPLARFGHTMTLGKFSLLTGPQLPTRS